MPEAEALFKGATFGEIPESPEIEKTQTGRTGTRTYRGTLAECQANDPEVGSEYSDLPGLYVTKTKISGDPPYCRLVVSLSSPSIDPPDDDKEDLPGAVWTLDWENILKPIETHPRYKADGEDALTDSDWEYVIDWKASTDKAEREALYDNASENAQKLLTKLKRQQDSYKIRVPIVRATTVHIQGPKSSAASVISNPPWSGAPEGYEYLYESGPIRYNKDTGIYVWEREWIGAEFIDPDFYNSDS